MFTKRFRQFIFFLGLAAVGALPVAARESDGLSRQFQTPPDQVHPWVYWVWLDVDIPRATITRDLEEMKAKGITGCILYGNQSGHWTWRSDVVLTNKEYKVVRNEAYAHSYMSSLPPGEPLVSWSPHWHDLVRFSARECGRLGINFVVCNGLANTSGDIPEEYGEQKLAWTATTFHGRLKFDGVLPQPRSGQPGKKHYYRDVAVLAVPVHPGFSPAEEINLTAKMDAAGHLQWEVPAGDWNIIRFAQLPTDARNLWGYFTDSMSAEALAKTWDVTMGPLLKEMTPEERRDIKGIEDDSWEAGKTTWTKRFPEEFRKRRGYDITPWLPVLAGVPMADEDTRQRVKRDYALTISDLIAEYHYARLNQLAHENGLTCYSEAAGPNYDQADMLKTSSRVDMAMAEFWMPSEHRPTMDSRFLLRNAASANHVYGKNVTLCESFTSLGPEWEDTPFAMKPVADQAFCDGLNQLCIHNFSQSPSLTAKPGYVYCAGTHYEPGVTWWDESPAFNDYLARCSFMLQQGKFVADALFYHGDNIGKGEARKTIPPTLGEGYDHDNCNSEVLLTRMKTKDGRIVLRDGMSYRVLVLPDAQPMPLADLKKIARLVTAGATIVGPPPTGMAGMILHPADRKKFDSLTARLWGGLDGHQANQKQVGTGHVFWGMTVREVLQKEGVPPDFAETGVSSTGTIDWIHRQTDDADIYYVASRWEHLEKVECTFRVAGRQPELWDPVTGAMRDATAFQQKEGRTIVPLQFDPNGSVFVVFRKPIATETAGTTASNYSPTQPLTTLAGAWTVNFNPQWGGPASVVFNQLMDWTSSSDPGIKFYSGTAVYHKTFDVPTLPAEGRQLLLDLGTVHEVASVRLNGRDLGVVWTKPARVNITGVVKSKDNDLEVTVVNLWPNRLIHDEGLPPGQRLTETNVHKFGPATPLLPSGLIGPVRLLTGAEPVGK